jgi:hypothetical protein
MKVELSIADDRELRAAIRDMIKGEVSSIMKGEIKNIIAELVKEGSWPKDATTLEEMVRKEVAAYVREQLKERWNSGDPLREITRDEVQKLIRERWKMDIKL